MSQVINKPQISLNREERRWEFCIPRDVVHIFQSSYKAPTPMLLAVLFLLYCLLYLKQVITRFLPRRPGFKPSVAVEFVAAKAVPKQVSLQHIGLPLPFSSMCRSQWPRSLRHELSSSAQTLGSWIRIPLKA
jgi:hypothetical protein